MLARKYTTALLILVLCVPSVPLRADCGCGGQPAVTTGSTAMSCCSANETSCCDSSAPTSVQPEPPSVQNCHDTLDFEIESFSIEEVSVSDSPVGCCGKSGDACKCSNKPGGCQCGDNCRCGEDLVPTGSEPVAPPSDSDNEQTQLSQLSLLTCVVADFHASASSQRESLFATQSEFNCLTSAQRCSQLCRFLR